MPRCKICNKGNSMGNGGLKCPCSINHEGGDMYSVLCALILLSTGNYRQRVSAEHYLKTSDISFEYGKAWYDNTDCPEFKVRMKSVLWVKWCMETQEKYGHSENYYYNEEVMEELRRKDFKREFRR